MAVARYLGPKDFGLYNFVLSIVTLVGVVASLGLQNLAKRELVEQAAKRNMILGTCFSLSVVSGAIAYICLLFTVGLISQSSSLFGLFALFGGVFFLNPLKFIEYWFQSQIRSDLSVSAGSISIVFFAVIKLIAIYMELDMIVFCYIYLAEIILLSALLVVFYGRNFGSFLNWNVELNLAAKLLRQSWPLLLSGLAITVYMKIDQVMLGIIIDEEAVGKYSAATKISTMCYIIPTVLATSLFPAILSSRKKELVFYTNRLQRYFDLNAGLAYLICVPLSITAPWIIIILFGVEYKEASPILTIHIWTSLFVFLGVARNQYLIAEKLYKFSMLSSVFGALLNVFGNWILIPYFSGTGAAFVTLASQITAVYLSCWFFPPAHHVAKLMSRSIFPIHLLRPRPYETTHL